MLPPSGKTVRAAQLRSLNQPRPVRVTLDAHGVPHSVTLHRRSKAVARVRDRWRVDDLWWREELSRMYYELELADGQVITLFHDRLADCWYQQWYG